MATREIPIMPVHRDRDRITESYSYDPRPESARNKVYPISCQADDDGHYSFHEGST